MLLELLSGPNLTFECASKLFLIINLKGCMAALMKVMFYLESRWIQNNVSDLFCFIFCIQFPIERELDNNYFTIFEDHAPSHLKYSHYALERY